MPGVSEDTWLSGSEDCANARTSGLDLRDWHMAQRMSTSRAVRPAALAALLVMVASGVGCFWWSERKSEVWCVAESWVFKARASGVSEGKRGK